MPTRFKVLAIAAALAAGTSSAAMAQYACAPGYTYINGVCQPVAARRVMVEPGVRHGVRGGDRAQRSGYGSGGPVGAVVGGALGAAAGALQGTANMLTPPRQRATTVTPITTGPATRLASSSASIRVADEDEGRAGHDRGAGADEGDVGVLDLA